MSKYRGTNKSPLPGALTELGTGLTREQAENVLQFNAVTVHWDGEPVAVLLKLSEYRNLYDEAFSGGVVGEL